MSTLQPANHCTHEKPEYKVMGSATDDPYLGLVCTDCGLIMEWIDSLRPTVLEPIVGNWIN